MSCIALLISLLIFIELFPLTVAVTSAVKATGALEIIGAPGLGNAAAVRFFETLKDGLLDTSSFLIDAAHDLNEAESNADSETILKKSFKLGPQGVTPIISFLHGAHQLLITRLDSSSSSSTDRRSFAIALEELEPLASALLMLVTKFRSIVPRVYWDPHGMRDLRVSMKDGEKYFPRASFGQRYSILVLNIFEDSPEAFAGALVKDFGSLDNCAHIHDSNIKIGEYGMTGFLDMMSAFLDDVPCNNDRWIGLFPMFLRMCSVLSQKAGNIRKNHARNERKSQSKENSKKGGKEEQEGKPGERQYSTRSASQNKPDMSSTSDSETGNENGSRNNPHVVDSESDLESMAEQVDDDIEADPTFQQFRTDWKNMREPHSYPNVDPQFMKEDFTRPSSPKIPTANSSQPAASEDMALNTFCDAKYSSIYELGRKVMDTYPSPDRSARMVWSDAYHGALTKKQLYKVLIKAYHPDKVMAHGALWVKRFTALSALVNEFNGR
ncbi:hypothetical protein BKA70DRAFT_1441590 [Coprinopsis sp. MPI-PUGE-AT-0042]|nr:hypothetical protein BKA70DRAFT_1441590 [Coprinopsis sp. MPI-PUGE-AT-0042]